MQSGKVLRIGYWQSVSGMLAGQRVLMISIIGLGVVARSYVPDLIVA